MTNVVVEQIPQYFLIFRAPSSAPARTVHWMGRPFRVVPAVLVRAQVLHNNLGHTYLPPDEITNDWAAMWNGIPVLVGPHPTQRGIPSSGRTPELWNERMAGWIFNAHADTGTDGTRRLTGEVWLDVERADVVDGLAAVLAAVDAGQPVELSTGFSTQPEEQAGAYNGRPYDWILHPIGADHLVISTEMTGACSVSDGCGLGVNCQCGGACMDQSTVDDAATGNEAGARTQSVDGTPHPARDFAYAPAGPPSNWKLPIFDAAHVRAALARFNQTQLPASVRAAVWHRILMAADRLNITVSDRTMPGHNAETPKSIWGKIVELLTPTPVPQTMSYEEVVAANTVRLMAEQQLTPSDQERAQMLKEALQEKYGDSTREVIVCDVYTEPERYVIFWFSTPMGAMPKGAEYYRASWADADNDGIPEITQVGDPELVRRQTSYEPVGPGPAGDGAPAGYNAEHAKAGAQVNSQQEDVAMDDQEKKAINDLTAAVKALSEQVAATNAKVTALESSDTSPAGIAGLKKSISALAEQVSNISKLTAPAVEERERERSNLVQSLAGNHRVPFTLAELEGKPVDELRKIAEMAQADNFSGRGGPRGAEEPQRFMPTRPYWEVADKSGDKK